MNLPKIQSHLNLNKQNLPLLGIILTVVLVLLGILAYSLLGMGQPKPNQKTKTEDPTAPTTIIHKGKTIAVSPKVEQIKPELVKAILDRKEALTIIQVMEAAEWQQGHILDSQFIPLKTLLESSPSFDKNSKILLVSKDGSDGALAAEKLIYDWGYFRQTTFNLEGGLDAWKKKGFPVEK